MYFCYFDESGDPGRRNSPTSVFVLSAVVVHNKDWLETFNRVIRFRRYLREQFGIFPEMELKASWLIHGARHFEKSKFPFLARLSVYEAAMRFQRKCGTFRTFAVAVPKNEISENLDIRDTAWQLAMEIVNSFGKRQKENMYMLPDEGNRDFLIKKLRTMRRADYKAASADMLSEGKIENIVEDPSDRKSHESFFIQLADLNAYAAAQKIRPGKNVDGRFWDALGDSRIKEVNSTADEPVGIKIWSPET